MVFSLLQFFLFAVATDAGVPSSARLRGAQQDRALSTSGPVHLLTDMWYDDLGAIAILKKFGKIPLTSIITTTGMMQAEQWAQTFKQMMTVDWNVTDKVSTSSADPQGKPSWRPVPISPCGGVGNCTQMNESVKSVFASKGSLSTETVGPVDWTVLCPPGSGCTIISLAPTTELASVLDLAANGTVDIQRIVMMGGFFKDSADGMSITTNDPTTSIQFAWPDNSELWPQYPMNISETATEVNIQADAAAFERVLQRVRENGNIELIMVPLEVASMSRFGKQQLLERGSKVEASSQANLSLVPPKQYCDSATKQPLSELQAVACMYDPSNGNAVTFDADAIAASYMVWDNLFTLERTDVGVVTDMGNHLDGQTVNCSSKSSSSSSACTNPTSVQVAIGFDAKTWYANLGFDTR
jgi:inosine-uridine nucleoside N-ribohydrolase